MVPANGRGGLNVSDLPGHHAEVPAALDPFFWPPAEGDRPLGQPPPGVDVLGHDGATFLIVRVDDSVVSVDPEGERFVNSSRRQFLDSLELMRTAWNGRAQLSEEAAVQQARALRRDLAACDEVAVRSEGHWWSLVLDELEYGVL
jgi:hypothetical protein